MRIAHIVCSYPPYYSGMGAVVLQTVDELASRGHEVEVITPLYEPFGKSREAAYPEYAEEQIDYASRITPRIQYGNAAYLPEIAKKLDDFDLVHLHYPFFGTATMVSRWKKKNPHKPLVVTYHMDTRAGGWKGLIFKYYAKYWMPRILGSADLLIASSQDYIEASDAARFYHASREKWQILPFGVDVKRFAPRKKPIDFFEHGFHPNVPTIIFVGGMDKAHYFKGVDVLLQALKILQIEGIDVQAVLVGDGKLRKRYVIKAKGYGIEQHVLFVGRVEDNILPMYYNMADLAVLPSTDRGEAFGMVLLEAMASGVPVVASDIPGVRSVARDGGSVVSPNDAGALAEAIAGFFRDDQERVRLGVLARRTVEEKYAWESIIDQLEGWYTELVDRQ